MSIDRRPEMDFGPRHHSGMPTAEELKWRAEVARGEYNARYYPHGIETHIGLELRQWAKDFQMARFAENLVAILDGLQNNGLHRETVARQDIIDEGAWIHRIGQH